MTDNCWFCGAEKPASKQACNPCWAGLPIQLKQAIYRQGGINKFKEYKGYA